MMTEGRVFICTWKQVGDRYRVWVKGRPRLAAEAADFADADEELWGVISTATGDGENLREYDPARPAVAQARLLSRLALVAAPGTAQLLNAAELFDGGICPDCKYGRGARTDVPMVLDKIKGGDVGYTRVGTYYISAGPRIDFYSDAFLRLLTAAERKRFIWRRVERAGRAARKVFYELVGSQVHVPYRVLVGGPERLQCDGCGQSRVPIGGGATSYPQWLLSEVDYRYEVLPDYFISAADLPKPLPNCLTAGHHPTVYDLCFLPSRWRQLVGQPGTKGVSTSDVGIVAPELVSP